MGAMGNQTEPGDGNEHSPSHQHHQLMNDTHPSALHVVASNLLVVTLVAGSVCLLSLLLGSIPIPHLTVSGDVLAGLTATLLFFAVVLAGLLVWMD